MVPSEHAPRTRARGWSRAAGWFALLAAALAGPSQASPAAAVTVTSVAALDALLQEGRLVIALFYKSYCPWCAEFMDIEWDEACWQLSGTPNVACVQVNMINYGVTSEVAARYSVTVAPTTLFISSSFVEPYSGPRTASGVTSATRTAYLRHAKAVTAAAPGQLGGPGKVERLTEACLDVVLLNTSAAFMLEVSARWPASPVLARAAAEGDLRVGWSSDPALAQRLGMKLRPGVTRLVAFPSRQAASATACATYRVASSLHIRELPSTSSAALGTVSPGDEIEGELDPRTGCEWLRLVPCRDAAPTVGASGGAVATVSSPARGYVLRKHVHLVAPLRDHAISQVFSSQIRENDFGSFRSDVFGTPRELGVGETMEL